MKYIYTCDSDVGISRKVNQDSLLVKKAKYKDQEIIMAIVCDGMGGLSKGEWISASVVNAFSKWFETELIHYLNPFDTASIGNVWSNILEKLNNEIREYGKSIGESMGTTFTGMLCYGEDCIIVHVGDSRLYRINPDFQCITTDQTLVYREYLNGNITLEEAETHPKRNVLLQCIGASANVVPEIINGKITKNSIYLLCSDGFRHVLTQKEMENILTYNDLQNEEDMHDRALYLIDLVKLRKEKDNISVILIKTIC